MVSSKVTLYPVEDARVLDVSQVVELEQSIAAAGTSLATLMNRAGASLAQFIGSRFATPCCVVALCGSGNNGGDGWVAARLLAERGYDVVVITSRSPEDLTAQPARDAAFQTVQEASYAVNDAAQKAAHQKTPVNTLAPEEPLTFSSSGTSAASSVSAASATPSPSTARLITDDLLEASCSSGSEAFSLRVLVAPPIKDVYRYLNEATVVIDALLGTGFAAQAPRGVTADWIAALKECSSAAFVLAADVPSGLNAQTGVASKLAVKADATITMIVAKPGLLTEQGRLLCGETYVAALDKMKA